jgi:hypothetical protein
MQAMHLTSHPALFHPYQPLDLKLHRATCTAFPISTPYYHVQVYGTSKTDKDLVFSAATLEALEQHLTPAEQQQYPLVMRPGMRLPRAACSSSRVESGEQCDREPLVQQQGQQVLTWRRYFHTQMAAVYSLLFRKKVLQKAAGCSPGGADVEHDFVFVR